MIVLVAVLLSVLLGFSALAVDTSIIYMQDTELQNAIDAGVLAGAWSLPDTTQAAAVCRQYIIDNCTDASNITITFEGANMVINASAEISSPALFSQIFGNDSLDGYAEASAQKSTASLGGPFDYRLFSGKAGAAITLGGAFYIDGDIHSNGSVSISPSTGTVTGRVEGCTTVYVNQWTATVGAQVPGAPSIAMVDFSSVVDSVLPDTYTTTMSAATINSAWWLQNFTGDIYVNGNVSISNKCTITGNMYVNGNITINGGAPVCVLNGSLYATGSIVFNNTVQINGSVFAGGSINFRGGMNQINGTSQVCVYSQTGNIEMTTAGTEARGIIYAPMGSVKIAGGTTTYYGSIIGNTIAGIPANLIMRPPTDPFNFMPEGKTEVRLIR